MTAMRKGITCCNQCPKRHVGCHSTCEDYQRESKEVQEFKALVKSNNMANDQLAEYYKHNQKRRRPPKPKLDGEK